MEVVRQGKGESECQGPRYCSQLPCSLSQGTPSQPSPLLPSLQVL